MSIFARIFEFRMGIGIEKSDKFQFVNQYVALGRCLRDGSFADKNLIRRVAINLGICGGKLL